MRWQRRPKPDETTSERARGAPPSVRYDVAVGLERHRKLVAAGTPLPAWAAQLPPRAPLGGRFRAWRWWLAGTLSIAGVVALGWPRTPPTQRSAEQAAANQAPPAGMAATDPQAGPRAHAARGEAASVKRDRDPGAAWGPGGEDARTRVEATTPAAVTSSAGAEPAAPGSRAWRRAAEGAGIAKSRPKRSSSQAGEASAGISADSNTEGETHGEAASEGDARWQRGHVQSPQDREEMRQLAQSEQLLASRPGETLRLVREGDARFPRGYFRQERRYLEVMALFALGQHGEARARAYWFLRDYPAGAYRKKVELTLQQYPP